MTLFWPTNPRLIEINAWTWLHALSDRHQRAIHLGTVPDEDLDALAAWHLDGVWLMGVWERSPTGRQIARAHPDLQAEYHHALPDFQPDDVIGSPYAVRRYEVDPHLGGREALAALRRRLADRGLRLVLDFVPNHTATDHAWLQHNPACYVMGTLEDLHHDPASFFSGPGRSTGMVFAHGRDPYFPAWTDTAQLNAFNPSLRALAANTLLSIASQCDGVRCDMAMLMTNSVFSHTWGDRVGRRPEVEFWDVVIPAVKGQFPQFIFMAEVYWDMEWDLIQQGFDYAYDKRLYDRLLYEPVHAITGHLRAEMDYQRHMVRFIENHDEPRAATSFGPGRDVAAAAITATLPGALLLHEGQVHAHQVKLPVQLGRRPFEPENDIVAGFYRALLAETAQSVYRDGDWQLCDIWPAWDGHEAHHGLIAYTWRSGEARRLVVVNYSAAPGQGRVALGHLGLDRRGWRLHDALNPNGVYDRDGSDMAHQGLYIDLPPWGAHLFAFR